MLEDPTVSETNILNIKYSSSLNTHEVEEARDMLSQMTQEVQFLLEDGKINLVRIQPESAQKDLHRVGLLSDMQRVAIVANEQWLQKIIDTLNAIDSTEVRTFGLAQRNEAFVWLVTPAQ